MQFISRQNQPVISTTELALAATVLTIMMTMMMVMIWWWIWWGWRQCLWFYDYDNDDDDDDDKNNNNDSSLWSYSICTGQKCELYTFGSVNFNMQSIILSVLTWVTLFITCLWQCLHIQSNYNLLLWIDDLVCNRHTQWCRYVWLTKVKYRLGAVGSVSLTFRDAICLQFLLINFTVMISVSNTKNRYRMRLRAPVNVRFESMNGNCLCVMYVQCILCFVYHSVDTYLSKF